MADLCTAIKEQVDVLEYMRDLGYHPVKSGSHYWKLKEHDSFVYDEAKKAVHWNSHGVHGSIIDLYMDINGCERSSAIRALRARLWSQPQQRQPSAAPAEPPKPPSERKAFQLPEYDPGNWRRVYAYLLKTRGLDNHIVKWLAAGKIIYPDTRGNLVYVSQYQDYAAKKGTAIGSHYRSVVDGGNYSARFCMNFTPETTKLIVSEAFVDAASFASMLQLHGLDFLDYGYLSLESCYEGPLQAALQKLPSLRTIYLAQDNDAGGMESRRRCRALLEQEGFSGRIVDKVPFSKDWNEDLLTYRQMLAQLPVMEPAAAIT